MSAAEGDLYLPAALAANALMTQAVISGVGSLDEARTLTEGADLVFVAAILAQRLGVAMRLLGQTGVDVTSWLRLTGQSSFEIAGGSTPTFGAETGRDPDG